MCLEFTSRSQEWELDITNDNKGFELVYEKINNFSKIKPFYLPIILLLPPTTNLDFDIMYNRNLLMEESMLPISIVTQFTTSKPKDCAFIIFNILGLNQTSYMKICLVPLSGKFNYHSLFISVWNIDIINYVKNTISEIYPECTGTIYMIIEKGTWLSKKEEKKKIIMFSSLGCPIFY